MVMFLRKCSSSPAARPVLNPLAAAGGAILSEGAQLHLLGDDAAVSVKKQFHGNSFGVLLAREQQPGNEDGLVRAARVVGGGPFAQTSLGKLQHYASRGRQGTPEAQHPRGSDFWHQDNSYLSEPSRFTALYATDQVPEAEADTMFVNLVTAWEALDDHLREKVEGLHAWHCHAHNGGTPHPQYPNGPIRAPQRHPVVRKHPITGQEALFLSPCYLREPDVPPGIAREEARALLRALTVHATQERFTFRHKWKPGDFLAWDNHVVMHRATTIDMSPDLSRVMFRMSFGD